MSQKQIGHKKTEMDSSRSSLQKSSGGFSTQFISRSVWSSSGLSIDLTLSSGSSRSSDEGFSAVVGLVDDLVLILFMTILCIT